MPALALLLASRIAGAATAPNGTYDGGIALLTGGNLPLVLHLARDGATVDSPTQNALGLKARLSTRPPMRPTGYDLTLFGGAADFAFRATPDGKLLRGIWHQGGMDAPASFSRREAGAPDPVPPRRQIPEPPYPYTERTLTLPGDGNTALGATLLRPRQAGRVPAVLMIPGSGPMDRDETIAGHKPFLVLADALARHGVAVLRYDKRGVGDSSGSAADDTLPVEAADAQSLFGWLAHQSWAGATGVLGHSEGAVIAAAIADRDRRAAYAVLLAPPALPGPALVASQARALMVANGVPPAAVARRVALEKAVLGLAQGPDPDRAKAAIIERLVRFGMDAPHAAAQATLLTTAPYRSLLDSDPVRALKALRVPALVLIGSNDLQVVPNDNLPPLRAALLADPRARIRVLPGLNHLLQPSRTGLPAAYAANPITISPAATAAIVGFVTAQGR